MAPSASDPLPDSRAVPSEEKTERLFRRRRPWMFHVEHPNGAQTGPFRQVSPKNDRKSMFHVEHSTLLRHLRILRFLRERQ